MKSLFHCLACCCTCNAWCSACCLWNAVFAPWYYNVIKFYLIFYINRAMFMRVVEKR